MTLKNPKTARILWFAALACVGILLLALESYALRFWALLLLALVWLMRHFLVFDSAPEASPIQPGEKTLKYWELVVQNLPIGLMLSDAEGRLKFANPASYSLLGFTERIEQRTLLEVLRQAELYSLFERARLKREPEQGEVTLRNPGVAGRQLWVSVAPLFSGERLEYLSLTFFDISQRLQLERTHREFVANVSHELKTPLTIIRGYAETLSQGENLDPELTERFHEKILQQAIQLQNLVGDVLKLAELDAGAQILRPAPVDLSALGAQLHQDFLLKLQAKQLEFLYPREPVWIRADPVALRQILVNLLSNAVQYSPAGGVVALSAETVSDALRIWVADQGPGISPSHQEQLFTRFYRVDPARSRESGGTGLGLAIVKHLAELQGGGVGVESSPGAGARFFVSLPQA